MAVKDGMMAISQVLKMAAILSAAGLLVATLIYSAGAIGVIMAICSFFLFWTPAWIIKKFVQ